MGGAPSQEHIQVVSWEWYFSSWQRPCLFPDVGVDQSLLTFSGTDSSAQLQLYSNRLLQTLPSYVSSIGTSLASLGVIPNAAGLGALLIAMILDLALSGAAEERPSYGLFRRVFGEEKASSVRDTMTEYVRRHQLFMNDPERQRQELGRFEAQLSGDLTVLRNSLLYDGQMGSRGMKIWANGASFHLLMLIHEARLQSQRGRLNPDHLWSTERMVDMYLRDLERLLREFRDHWVQNMRQGYKYRKPNKCYLINAEKRSCYRDSDDYLDSCPSGQVFLTAYVDRVFSNYPPLLKLREHFLNLKKNLNVVVNQHDTFRLPRPV